MDMAYSLGNLIKYYREQKGLTQEELALAIGHKGKTSISKIERGINSASYENILAISKALNIDPVVFMEQYSFDKYAEFHEFLPYLAEADEVTLANIRAILRMPEKKSSSSDSTKEIV